MGKKKKHPPEQENLVITPGGPRPKEQVRTIKPGEALRRNADGSYTVVRIEKPSEK
ncbi:MAG TPA: hypothetical protein VMH04_09000 [Candidatus Solibacter sp.]|nr:hypothetical protein [Candidatus Solibacter sp.]